MLEPGASFTQIAFVSNDWRKSAKQWIDVMSAGPFFILKLPPLKKTYRGRTVCDTFEAAISFVGRTSLEIHTAAPVGLENKQFGAKANAKCDVRVDFRGI